MASSICDRQQRVEVARRVLEDHGDAAAAQAAHRLFRQAEHILALEQDGAGHDARWRCLVQPQQAARQHRLAAAGLADDAQRLAGLQRQVDAVEHVQRAVERIESQSIVADLEQAHPRWLLGSRMSRSPSPSRLKPSTLA
jgi:hypothetical protein